MDYCKEQPYLLWLKGKNVVQRVSDNTEKKGVKRQQVKEETFKVEKFVWGSNLEKLRVPINVRLQKSKDFHFCSIIILSCFLGKK